jgi:2,3-bisphosphoglycerate-independent phosphoglycerate mutase
MTIRERRLTDFTAGHITNEEGRSLIEAIQADIDDKIRNSKFEIRNDKTTHESRNPKLEVRDFAGIEFHPGVSYRNLMIYRGRPGEQVFTDETITDPPHDHPDAPVVDHLPRGPGAGLLAELMSQASTRLAGHPVNRARIAAGQPPANAIWLWGQGKAPCIPKFRDLHELNGAIISAVDLVRGVGVLAGWSRIDVPGATGYLDTDYAAKGRYAIKAVEDHDIVCVHVEAPDEASHEGRHQAKVEALERIDHDIVGPVSRALQSHAQWRILISPDHSTLLRTRAHDRAPVAWAMAGTGLPSSGNSYDEASARCGGGPRFDAGYRLMTRFLDLSWDGRG